ncbi:hypothetical protein SAMN04487995_2327 [Dyadobacter koreensis]|uniref:Uncharacterized protein n=1 Tax=Dyadobacter koreensis TaxID=408657 RepID=A0A1H6TYF8_9BACT|nr:hypothetical protein [Dyadobacter koreensis]SEI81255.1 hypothetical protein SAMN04487995_2327 [Dyadobacter koreensis]
MSSNQESLHTLNEIRDLMERSNKFLSLSGLSGVFAGVFALIGAAVAYVRLKTDWFTESFSYDNSDALSQSEVIRFLLLDGILVLFLSLTFGIFLTIRKSQKKGFQVWNKNSRRLVVSMIIPLATGGIFCLAMLSYGYIWLVLPATLIFYGLALVNASRHTWPEVFYMGIFEIIIGSLALFFTGFSLLFWAIGFGILHIVYGFAMYNKYDREGEMIDKSSRKGGIAAIALFLLTATFCQAQISAPTAIPIDSTARKWYDKETIYLQGSNSYIKDNILYKGQKAIKREFMISPGGMQLYVSSRKKRNIALVISLAGSGGSIASLITGNRDSLKKFFWVSLGTGLASTIITAQANNQRDQAVWLRNRDALLFMEVNK